MQPAVANVSVYERLRPHLNAEDILRRLGVDVVKRVGAEAYCNPICHASDSGESLQINLHTGRWSCKACMSSGVAGDMIQFVEYWQTGGRAPSKGHEQGSSADHREAVRWLCEQFAVPFDDGRAMRRDPALEIVHLFAMAAHQHLLRAPEVLAWIHEKWGFDQAVVEQYGIGFMPSPILPSIAAEANHPSSRDAFRSSGVGYYPSGGSFDTRFEGRVLFPYLDGSGRAVYLIGRATPWTPQREGESHIPKYHKLSVHSETRPYISKSISNDHLYNEVVLDESKVIVVTEGVADAVALSSIGVPVTSPVTINFNEVDLDRFIRKCKEREISRVEVLFDDEMSGSGNFGALRVGRKFTENGLAAIILSLPVPHAQMAAREEVKNALGARLDEFNAADPRRRKEIISEVAKDDAHREWIKSQIAASKIDAAEWVALEGPGAAEKFAEVRRAGVSVIALEVARLSSTVQPDASASDRLAAFDQAIALVAHLDDRILRGEHAGVIAKAAGKGVSKADVAQRIAAARKAVRAARREEPESEDSGPVELVTLPPEIPAPSTPPPPAPAATGRAPGLPSPSAITASPTARPQTEHERYAPVRESVSRAVDKRQSEEVIGKHVAETITVSMGYTAFRTPDDLVLVRGSERVEVGMGRPTPSFGKLLYMASGLIASKQSHRGYIATVIYFLELASTRARDVSWSHYDPDASSVFFPTGDKVGSIIRITPGAVYLTKMSESRVPAVAGKDFRPITYKKGANGAIDAAFEVLRYTSISPSDRLLLTYWMVCLPILRKIGQVPILRVEGGSSSGKSRALKAVSHLVNGAESSEVPTAAALIANLSTEMLTVDDNRESKDMTDQIRGTLLQATGLGARRKRKVNSDTGTVVERVCGALIMNGIEPIHDGRSELASRILTLRCDGRWRAPDSPQSDEVLCSALAFIRDEFWSEAAFRCAQALELDERCGEEIGAQIETLFGETRIGRLARFMRLMYLTWVVGRPAAEQQALLARVSEGWCSAFAGAAGYTLQSLMQEELAVSAMRYVFSWCADIAEPPHKASDDRFALSGKYRDSVKEGDAFLGPLSFSHLARLVRAAAKEKNAPRSLSTDLSAGQLQARVMDGLGFLRDAGFDVEVEETHYGKARLSVYRRAAALGPVSLIGGDTWQSQQEQEPQ